MTAVLAFVRDATYGILRDFVVDVARNGVIRVKGLSPAVKAAVVVSTVLVLAAMAALLTAEHWRDTFELIPVQRGTTGRGTLFPVALAPVALFLVAVGFALMLAGALRTHPAVRWSILAIYVSIALTIRDAGTGLGLTEQWEEVAGWAAIGVVVAVFVVSWRLPPRPGIEFGVVLAAVATTFAIAQSQLVRIDRFTGENFALGYFERLVGDIRGLVPPLIFVAGLGVVSFAVTASGWVLDFVDKRVHQRAVFVLLGVLLVWRLGDLGREVLDAFDGAPPATGWLGGYLGGAGVVVVIAGVWWAVNRLAGSRPDAAASDDDHAVGATANRSALPMALALQAAALALFVAVLAVNVVLSLSDNPQLGLLDPLTDAASFLARQSVVTRLREGIAIAGIVAGLVLAARGRRLVGLYVAAVAAVLLYADVTRGWQSLRGLRWDEANVDLVWTLVFAAVALWWAARRQLTEIRAERLFFVVLLSALIRQGDFISNPFSLFLGFAGVGFVVFGLVFGFVSAGAWANTGTPAFPRTSRLYLYLGYTLFSITMLLWYVGSHQAGEAEFLTSTEPTNGYQILGMPLVYCMYLVMLTGAVANRPVRVVKAVRSEADGGEAEGVAHLAPTRAVGIVPERGSVSDRCGR